MMKRVGNIISGLFGYYLFYLATKYVWSIYPLDDKSEHLRETVGDVYIMYLVLGLAFFLFICIRFLQGELIDISITIEKIEKKLDEIYAAMPKQPESVVNEEPQDETAEAESIANEKKL